MKHYHWAALFTRNVGMALSVVAVGFGLLSETRLSRWLSTYLLVIAVAWHGWDAVGLPGSLHPWNVISHPVIGLAIALPALLAHAWRRVKGTAYPPHAAARAWPSGRGRAGTAVTGPVGSSTHAAPCS